MKLLAIDSSGLVASTAIIQEDDMVAEYTANFKKTHSQTLLPMIDEIVRMTETDLESFDAIAVASGPGSFTGLRIGSATAKGLGLSLQRPLISIPTVDALAFQLFGVSGIICPLMDARRSQVYTGLYTFKKGTFTVLEPQMAISIEEILKKINERGEPVVFLGDGVAVYRDIIESGCKTEYCFAPPHANKQRAAAAGALAKQYLLEGKIETAEEHRPEYLRMSQAERERMEKQG